MRVKPTPIGARGWVRGCLALALGFALVAATSAAASPRDEAATKARLARWAAAFAKKAVAGVMAVYEWGPALVSYDIAPPLQ